MGPSSVGLIVHPQLRQLCHEVRHLVLNVENSEMASKIVRYVTLSIRKSIICKALT